MYCGTYAIGDKNSDGSRFLPSTEFNNDATLIEYNDVSKEFEILPQLGYALLGGEAKTLYHGEIKFTNWLNRQAKLVYEEIDENLNNNHQEIVRFKIARTFAGRMGILEMFKAQIEYADFDGDDELENAGMTVSPRVKKSIGKNPLYGKLNHKGSYNYCVNPDVTDDDGLYNGW